MMQNECKFMLDLDSGYNFPCVNLVSLIRLIVVSALGGATAAVSSSNHAALRSIPRGASGW